MRATSCSNAFSQFVTDFTPIGPERVGARWGIGPLHKILTRATYKGEHHFNRTVWKTKEDVRGESAQS
jgi:hypothetical protein